jgi:predicted secreted hydrolase
LGANVVDALSEDIDLSQFDRVYEPRELIFPDDLGAHPTYQTEWWYYTGNLADAAGNRYGLQLTFFRRALAPQSIERSSEWGSSQIYFAHFTVTDAAGRAYYPFQRFSRGAADLAGAQSRPYRVWLEDWEAIEIEPGIVRLRAKSDEVAIDLQLESTRPLVLQGDQGFSPKGTESGNASYYYSFTRLAAVGTISLPDKTADVTGLLWKDHEWSTSALSDNTQGWDWFSLQLDDGRDLMYSQIRQQDNETIEWTEGTVIEADGTTRRLAHGDVQVEVLDDWESPLSNARYPAKWSLVVPSAGIDVTITPLLANQEVPGAIIYWEGAVRIEGTQTGYGYVELTGYAQNMQGRF